MKKKKRFNKGIPRAIDRLDQQLLSEIKIFYNLCNDVNKTAAAYHVTVEMVKYAITRGKDFNNLNKEEDQ